jgi:hypothetical protein
MQKDAARLGRIWFAPEIEAKQKTSSPSGNKSYDRLNTNKIEITI